METITLLVLLLGLCVVSIPLFLFPILLIGDLRAKTRISISHLPSFLVTIIPMLLFLFIPALKITASDLRLFSPMTVVLLLAWYGAIFVAFVLGILRQNNKSIMDFLRNLRKSLISVNFLKGVGVAVMWVAVAIIGGLGGIWISSLVFPGSRDSDFIGMAFGLLGVFGAVKLFSYLINSKKSQAQQKQSIEKPAGRLVKIRIACPHCGTMTIAILPNNGDERDNEPEIICEQCKTVFKFKVGMPYEPIGYVN